MRSQTKKKEDREGHKANLIQEERSAQGSVGWKVYGSYTKSLGGPIFWILVALAFLSQQGLNLSQTYWIREWASSYQTRGRSQLKSAAFFIFCKPIGEKQIDVVK